MNEHNRPDRSKTAEETLNSKTLRDSDAESQTAAGLEADADSWLTELLRDAAGPLEPPQRNAQQVWWRYQLEERRRLREVHQRPLRWAEGSAVAGALGASAIAAFGGIGLNPWSLVFLVPSFLALGSVAVYLLVVHSPTA